eukprot:COSAG04_NODE_3312_length_2945_cov_25.122277_1_plen_330_part_00
MGGPAAARGLLPAPDRHRLRTRRRRGAAVALRLADRSPTAPYPDDRLHHGAAAGRARRGRHNGVARLEPAAGPAALHGPGEVPVAGRYQRRRYACPSRHRDGRTCPVLAELVAVGVGSGGRVRGGGHPGGGAQAAGRRCAVLRPALRPHRQHVPRARAEAGVQPQVRLRVEPRATQRGGVGRGVWQRAEPHLAGPGAAGQGANTKPSTSRIYRVRFAPSVPSQGRPKDRRRRTMGRGWCWRGAVGRLGPLYSRSRSSDVAGGAARGGGGVPGGRPRRGAPAAQTAGGGAARRRGCACGSDAAGRRDVQRSRRRRVRSHPFPPTRAPRPG